MTAARMCPRCGSALPIRSPEGLCPRCMLMAGMGGESAGDAKREKPETVAHAAHDQSVLETIEATIGAVPRIMLRDTALGEAPSPILRPSTEPDPALRYRIDGEIARGGMGSVLKGRDPDLCREVAIKVLQEVHSQNDDMVRRFVEEAQIGGQLQHPGVVPIYELGTFADRRPFFSMKLVKGRTLAELLAARGSPADDLPRFLSIYSDVAQTMAYAHTRGVIHRDLKPSNVMVGNFGEVQVMDWGLAKVLPRGGAAEDAKAGKEKPLDTLIATARSGSDTDLSHAGSVMGTPSYMAPEQARGEVERLDERADVFALGSILCEILTGAAAFTGRSSAEILRKTSRGDAAEALARLDRSGCEAELITLTKDCLEVEPDDRPRDANVVSERITAYLAGVQERVQAAERERAVAVARAIEERRRRKVQLALAASILALTTLGGLSAAYYLQQRADRTRRRIERDAAIDRVVGRAETLRDQAKGHAEDVSRWEVALAAVEQAEADREIGSSPRLLEVSKEVRAGLTAARHDKILLDRLVEIRSAADEDADGWITVNAYANAFRDAGFDPVNLPPAEVGAKIKARPAAIAGELAATLDAWAEIRQGMGPNNPAAAQLREVARIADPDPWRNELRAAVEQSDEEARRTRLQTLAKTANFGELGPISLLLLARGLWRSGDRPGAEALLRKAQARHPGDLWINVELGNMLRAEESIRFYTAARAIRPEMGHMLAHALDRRGSTEEALDVFRRAAELRPGDETSLGCFGDLLKRKGLAREAGEAYAAAERAGREAVRGKPDSPEAHSSLARALMRQDKLDDAADELRTVKRLDPNYRFNWPGSVSVALVQVKQGIDSNHYQTDLALLYVQHNRGHELERSKPREAEALFRRVLDGYRELQGPEGFMTVDLTCDLARILIRSGRIDEAESLTRNAFRPGDIRTLAIDHELAHALETSKPAETERLFRQALEGYRKTQGPDGPLTIDLESDLADLLSRTDRGAESDPLFRDAVEQARKRFGPADARTAAILAKHGLSLLRQEKWGQAEPVLRECVEIREKALPDEWATFNARSMLGAGLLGLEKFAEAEPLIVSGYEGLKAREAKIPAAFLQNLTRASERVVKLYDDWGKPDKAAEWHAKLAKTESRPDIPKTQQSDEGKPK